MPPVDPADAADLYGQTVGMNSNPTDLHDDESISLNDIDAMEPIQFENWVLEKSNYSDLSS